MKLSKTELLVETAQWQQSLITASRLAEEVLKQAGDMGTCEEGSELSNAVKILKSCTAHFNMEQCDLESELNSKK